MKVKHQLLLTHGLLVILALLIVLINFVSDYSMDNDAVIINQSGKLRALSFNMSQLSNRIYYQEKEAQTLELKETLKLRMEEFDQILFVLGGDSQAGISHPETLVQLNRISREWQEIFKPRYVNILNHNVTSKIHSQINEEVDRFVKDVNDMVMTYSDYSRSKVFLALKINAGLVVVILLVTLFSYTSTNQKIRKPMDELMQDLKELSQMDLEVASRFKDMNVDEITEMTHYFSEMMYDQLTKAYNRRSGLAKLSRLLYKDNRRQLKLSLCFIDINGLKEVNDQLGHKQGDELIVSVVEGIRRTIREEDFVIRMGGDEFLIALHGIDEAVSESVWTRINEYYSKINELENRPYVISVSHGIVEYNSSEKSELDALIKHADDRMYLEKKYLKEEKGVKIIRSIG